MKLYILIAILACSIVYADLEISDLDITVDDHTQWNILDGGVLSDDVKADSKINLSITVKSIGEDMQNVLLLVKNNELNMSGSNNIGNLANGSTANRMISFIAPSNISRAKYTFTIQLSGTDPLSNPELITWTVDFYSYRNVNPVYVSNLRLEETTVQCKPRQTKLLFDIKNTGSKKEKEISVLVSSHGGIGISHAFVDMDLNETSQISKELPILIDEETLAGNYTLTTDTIYKSDISKFNDKETVQLIVKDCTVVNEVNVTETNITETNATGNTTTQQTQEEANVTSIPTTEKTTENNAITGSAISKESKGISKTTGLTIMVVVLVAISIFLIKGLFKKE